MTIFKRQNVTLVIAAAAGFAAVLKFLLDGITLKYRGYTFDLGHMDSMSYIALLAPALGAHSYMELKSQVKGDDQNVDKAD